MLSAAAPGYSVLLPAQPFTGIGAITVLAVIIVQAFSPTKCRNLNIAITGLGYSLGGILRPVLAGIGPRYVAPVTLYMASFLPLAMATLATARINIISHRVMQTQSLSDIIKSPAGEG